MVGMLPYLLGKEERGGFMSVFGVSLLCDDAFRKWIGGSCLSSQCG